MTETPRGTPPNEKQLKKHLGERFALWNGAIAMVREFGATWRWVHSETTGQWTYRSYLPGERFFVALSLQGDDLEASLNLKAEEWDAIHGENAGEREQLDALHKKAIESGDDPAWVHAKLAATSDLNVLAKLLFARGRRVQAPRKKRR
jgi:hypothetical protein